MFRYLFFTVMLSIISLSPMQSEASDYTNKRFRVFENVERVFVGVSYFSSIDKKSVPDMLRRENIEKKLWRLYTERFSSEHCAKFLDNRSSYSCDNQPVTLIPYGANNLDSIASAEELRDDGTLIVVLIVHIGDSYIGFDPPRRPVANFYVIQNRPGKYLPIADLISVPLSIPLDQSEE